MFWHIFKNRLKVTLADKETVFWVILFPIVLGFLFNLAFSNIDNSIRFKPIPIAVVNDDSYKADKTLSSTIDMLSKEGDKKVFSVNKTTREEAQKQLNDGKVEAVIRVADSKPELLVKSNGVDQTIATYAIDQTIQMQSSIREALEYNPRLAQNPALASIGQENYINDVTNTDLDTTTLYFYTLIGMACIYAGILGMMSVNQNEANLSKLGMRLSASPANRRLTLLASLASDFLISFAGLMLLYAFLVGVLKVDFGEHAWTVILVMIVGSLVGIAIGMTIAAATKFSENGKIGIMIAVAMAGSFLAGMMGTEAIKHSIDQHAPFFAMINPVNLLSDSLLSTYYFGVGQRFWGDIMMLIIILVILVSVSSYYLRKKSYASL